MNRPNKRGYWFYLADDSDEGVVFYDEVSELKFVVFNGRTFHIDDFERLRHFVKWIGEALPKRDVGQLAWNTAAALSKNKMLMIDKKGNIFTGYVNADGVVCDLFGDDICEKKDIDGWILLTDLKIEYENELNR